MVPALFQRPAEPSPRPVAIERWLLAVACLVFLMVIVGGITRLTESGLSIVHWEPVSGAIPPLGDAAWQQAFEQYKASPQYQLVNSGMTLAIVNGLTVGDISENAVANLGFDEVRLPAPVFVGDTLYAESTITGKRESKSRPYAGIINVETRGFNQDDTTVITYKRTAMIYTRAGSPRFK